ncbi:uncharacterized protein LOC132721715 isoform X2 [Ruditapes philippinarum]|uniref:uncharacterized protein LOC132721715 isoform X2 n=1 Tax=Ruditapes philippinarum TaxID=129788 RepID=UPI00295BF3FF|nr:uncharacterized protein LOC132721715 isoform X2 [Ruditapes philippinarum]
MFVIQDFNTGNSYTVDTERGNCTISPISNTSFSTTSLNNKHFRMRTAQELFFLDNTTYAYTGTKTIRGILCDVFISRNTYLHFPGYPKFNSTFEMYFTHDKWLHASNMIVPVQMRISSHYAGINWTYNFYDFTVGQRSNEIFSIRSCFNHKSQTSFKISFPGLWDHSLTSYQNMLILKITELISTVAHVPQLRIQDRQLIISTDSFYFIATLLDKPPSTGLTQFTTDNVSMTSAMTELKNNVIIGNFSLTVNISGQLRMIKADSIQENIDGSELETLSSNTWMNKFTVQVNKAVPGFSGIIFTGLSIDECATRCLNELLIICNAFTYSLTSGYCSLLNIRPNEVPAIIQNTMSSYLYIKKYTVDFEMIPGTTVLSSSNTVYHVNSVEMCAKLCISYKSFSCKSFEFCDNTSTCVLGHSHFYDIPKSYMKDSAICNHYSRKYLSDFKPMGNLYLTPVYDRVISGVNVEQCAKLCVEEEGLECASFAYCFNTTECRPRRKRNISQVSSLLIPPKCNVYNRETYRDGTPYSSISSSTTIPPTSTDTPKTGQTTNNYKEGLTEKIVLKDSSSSPIVKKGLSAGGVVGVAFGMLTAGLLIALIALAGIKRIKKKQTNEMKSTLTEHELE